MTKPGALSDAELLARAHRWRLESTRGVVHARGLAHEHEAEVRRRFSQATTLLAPIEPRARKPKRSLWRFWREC